MKAIVNAVKWYSNFRNENSTVLASATGKYEKAVAVTATATTAIANATIAVATVIAAKEANGFMAKSGKYIAGVYLSEYATVAIEVVAVAAIQHHRKKKEVLSYEYLLAKLEAEEAELEAAREAREAKLEVGRAEAEARWKKIAAAGTAQLDAIRASSQPLDWLRPLTAEQNALYEEREANQD